MDGLTVGLFLLLAFAFAAYQWAKHLKDHNR